jgi:transposase
MGFEILNVSRPSRCHGLSGCRICSKPDKMKYTLKAAPAASAIELKNEKSAKAKRILVGADVHLRGYQAARKIDNGVIGVVENFRSEEALMLYVDKQCERAEQVVVVYEAGPLCFTLYRKLTARGVFCYVCAPDSSEQQSKRRKNNKIDARNLTSKLFNYLNGDQEALQLARVPTEAQEQLRVASRQHDQLVEERKRLGSQGQRHALEPGLWELEQLVAAEGLDPIELPSAAMAAGEAEDLGRCAQDARRENLSG